MEGLKQVIEVRKVEKEYDGTVSIALDGAKPNVVRSVYLTLDKPEDIAKFPIGKKFNIVIAAANVG